ncbi:SUN domain-containing ossification factor-like isoform X2 [Periophthalmus magnuspinnatus]|uniref:SUN domain-containing ossification factor-like isoform X2 n=1 Tax=Periophthalmus magnuspinnatus TaxID=409849 RepID=UPI00145AE6A8|nr:SUN domain-containing ossification factor-like isoform X2 [Periophthalmus magnuspinnatus]
MKMTFLLWRAVSLWLCVAVLFLCLDESHVSSAKHQEEAKRLKSTQDMCSEKGCDQMTHNEKLEAAQSFSDNVHPKGEEDEIKDEHKDKREQRILDSEVPAMELFGREEPKEDEHEQNSAHELDKLSTLPSSEPDSSLAAEFKDGSMLHIQEEILESVSDHAPVVAEVNDSDSPAADCEVEPNPFDGDSPPMVLENTSNAHTTGTKSLPDPPLGSPAAPSTQHLETNVSHMLQDQSSSGPAETDSNVGSKDPEDIPTFDEWKRKVMEVEKEKTVTTHTSTNGAAHPVKKAQKNFNNYASVECGAKILGANPEAKSTSSILKENMDLYMLNPCSNKIWFVIELCEPVQVKQLDIANFELFSSTPKDFLVSISDRYPTNKWLKLGTFHARDERTVQSFPLDEHLYAKYVKMFTKYIKVEMISHFGSEHFCPLSLIRVFGTSMVEEYEQNTDPSERPEEQDDDLDYPAGYAPGEGDSKNLIGSAKDAIFNMVKDIAVVLGGSDEMPGNITSQEVNMTEPQLQPETATETKPNIQPEPELEDFSKTATPGTEMPEAAVTDSNNDESAAKEEQIVIPLEKDEDEPSISSTIIYLGEEEVAEENLGDQQKDPCAVLTLAPACSCAASLHEYLLQTCLLHIPQNCTNCQTAEQLQTDVPNWVIYQPPSSYPQPQQTQKDSLETPDKEDSVSEHENKASFTENTLSSNIVSQLELQTIEPSQTSDHRSTIEPSVTIAIPAEETPQLVFEVPIKLPNSEINQDSAEEKQIESTGTLSSTVDVVPTVSATLDDATTKLPKEKKSLDLSQEIKSKEDKDPAQIINGKTPHSELEATVVPDENKLPEIETIPNPLPSDALSMDSKMEDLNEDIATGISRPSAAASPSVSDIYAEPPNGTELNGSPVHGSSQKESVFMRLNNRIKALEMNMSLSGRYLEQLSQRYRKQMEEMQKAFNKTIIKLQNTSRVAEEQDLRQTESIQQLQGQLANVTRLVLNLSVQVSQLQSEVSDRESYLLLSLFMCLCLGLLLYVNRCRMSSTSCSEPEPPISESYTYCCPERQFSSDEAALKRSASYPLIHSDSFQLASTMGPEILQHEETQSLCPAIKKRRRRKVKSLEKVETLKPSLHAAEPVQIKGLDKTCNGGTLLVEPNPLAETILQPPFRDAVSEGSSEGSSHSDDPSFCGITSACNRICDGLPAKSRAERRALRRRRPTHSGVVDYLKAPSRHKRNSLPIYTIHDIMDRQEQSSCGLNVHLSGPV